MIRLIGIIISLFWFTETVWAQTKQCPADASKASYSIWRGGAVPTGAVVVGLHSCGKKLRCIGSTKTGSNRRCVWLAN